MSHRSLRACALIAILLTGVLFLPRTAPGANKNRAAQPAKVLVEEALAREVYGQQSERNRLLEQASTQSPRFAPAKWHLGLVRFNNRWHKADELPGLVGQSQWLRNYQNARSRFPQTAAGQLALADWCRNNNLPEQERAHLTRVLDFEPENMSALARLGFRNVNGRWIPQHEIERFARQSEQHHRWLTQSQPQVAKILKGLQHRSRRQREIAQRELEKINNPAAIPAMEQILGRHSAETARLMVKSLDNMNDSQASLALVRQAVLSPWSDVRQAAARRLKSRDRDAFVPPMLAAMHTPINTRTVAIYERGQMMLLQSMTREGQDEREQVVVKTPLYQRNAEAIAQRENFKTQTINERVTDSLNIATDQQLPADPTAWWKWWNEENEVFVQGEKPVRSVGHADQLARVDRGREMQELERARRAAQRAQQFEQSRSDLAQRLALSRSMSQVRRRSDCLAAGTPVWTLAGQVAVERVQVGDLVLSQNPNTGELAYKPVLRTTIRPTSVLVKIQAGNETIEASGGHPFWVSGEGWVKARELQSGMELHCVSGTVRISKIEEGQTAQTYNMIVADFKTYFVGEAKILNHDNTVREPTNAIVPGLVQR